MKLSGSGTWSGCSCVTCLLHDQLNVSASGRSHACGAQPASQPAGAAHAKAGTGTSEEASSEGASSVLSRLAMQMHSGQPTRRSWQHSGADIRPSTQGVMDSLCATRSPVIAASIAALAVGPVAAHTQRHSTQQATPVSGAIR